MISALLLLAAVIVLSFLVHEYAHALAARMCGWERRGWYFKLPWAVGLKFEANGQLGDRWIVALWGLAASALLAVAGLYVGGLVGAYLVALNATLFFVNAIPIPGTDGWWVLKAVLPARD